MSASQASALTAIMFQLAAALEAYDADVERMLASPLDGELYQRVAQQMDDMRMYAASLPKLSVPWVELLIRHFELAHGLWRVQAGTADAAEIARLRESQRMAAKRLHDQCVQLLSCDEARTIED